MLLSTSHRVAPGLLSWPAWQTLRTADAVRAAEADHPLLPALDEAGVECGTGQRDAAELVEEATAGDGRTVVWVLGPDGDPRLTGELASLSTRPGPFPELELLPGSYDLPGARLLDLVRVMDRLRSPGGCPWDAEQTHTSLVTYLVEESYELVEAIEDGDREALVEELGDVLLQVLFHSRVAEEDPDDPFSVDDVAGATVEKLMRRHPHVFGGADADTVEQVTHAWDRLKAEEKRRESATDGVPLAQPALSLTAKLISRAERAGVPVPVPRPEVPGAAAPSLEDLRELRNADGLNQETLGALLLSLVDAAHARGLDAEAALRAAARTYREWVRERERQERGS